MASLISGLRQIGRAIRSFLFSLLGWARRDFIWALLIIPILSSVLVYRLSAANFLEWGDYGVFKAQMEVLHPALLAGFLLVSLLRLWVSRDAAFAFLAVLSVFVLGRELMGQGSTILLYAGLTGLIVYGNKHPDRIASLLRSKWATSFLGMCFVCYLSSQLLDRGVVKRIGWLIFWDTSWQPPFSSNLEEALESLGGLFLLFSPFVIRAGDRSNSSRDKEPTNPNHTKKFSNKQ